VKDRDKINWAKVNDLITQHDACLRCANELSLLSNTEAAAALGEIRQEIIEEIGGQDVE